MIHIGFDYYPEHWDKSLWEPDAKAMRAAGVNTIRIAEFTWGLLEPREGEFDFVWLDEVISIFAKEGILVILGTPTNCAPLWLYNNYPQTRQVDRDGKRTPTGIRGHRCMTDPTYREYAKRVISKMVERYVDNPQVIAWQIDNELEGNHCCCQSCTEDFRGFVRSKYGTLEKLNQAWGTDVWSGQISEWNQIIPPLGALNQYSWYNPAYLLDYERWSTISCVQFLHFQSEIIREYRTDAVITTNACFNPNMPDFHSVFSELDIASYDNYPEVYLPEDPEKIYSTAFALDMVRGYKNKNFWIVEQLSGSKGCWIPISPIPRPGMIKGYAWQSLSRGADMLLLFRWRTATSGAEMFWHGLIDGIDPSGRRYDEFVSFSEEVHKISELEKTCVVSKIAILYSHIQDRAFRIQQQSEGYEYWEQLRLWHDGFLSLGVNVDIIHADCAFDKYDIVVAPTQFITDEGLVSRLEDYVQAGGTLVMTNRSGVKDENNTRLTGALPNAFTNLCGCSVIEYDPIGAIQQKIVLHDDSQYTIQRWCDILQLHGATEYARYADSFYEGKPAICVNSFGKGTCMYVGTVAERSLYKRIAGELLSKLGIKHYPALPTGVEVSTRENERVLLTFVFNNTATCKNVIINNESLCLTPFEMKIQKQIK